MQVVPFEKSESSLGSVGLCSLRPESTGELFDSLEDHVFAKRQIRRTYLST